MTLVRAGDILENPVTGERIIFHKTARDTRGKAVLIETVLQPKARVAAVHLHPRQEECFEIVGGSVGFRIGRRKFVARSGQRLTVAARMPHRFWNAGHGPARFFCEIRPALGFETLIETMFSLAVDGRTNRRGMPNPLQLAVIAGAHFDIVRLPFPPAFVQRMGLALGVPLGRLLGYRATYVSSTPPTSARGGCFATSETVLGGAHGTW